MTKSMIAPIIAVLALFVKAAFNIEVPQETQDNIIVFILAAIAVFASIKGIIKNHKKEGEK